MNFGDFGQFWMTSIREAVLQEEFLKSLENRLRILKILCILNIWASVGFWVLEYPSKLCWVLQKGNWNIPIRISSLMLSVSQEMVLFWDYSIYSIRTYFIVLLRTKRNRSVFGLVLVKRFMEGECDPTPL